MIMMDLRDILRDILGSYRVQFLLLRRQCTAPEAAALTGLSTDTVVLAGAVDATAAALEIGVTRDGKVAEVTGTSSLVLVGFDHLVTTYDLCYLRGRKPGSTVLYGPMNTAGGSLKWFRNHLYDRGGGDDVYDRINAEVESGTSGPSGLIYLPYLTGERAPIWDPDARGCFIGLHMDTSRRLMMRSVMEGTSFALQDNLETAHRAGFTYDGIISCGGCTKSEIWLKIKASVINRPIYVPEVNHGAQGGLAYMNAAFLGEFASPEEASESCFRIGKTVEPVPGAAEALQKFMAAGHSVYIVTATPHESVPEKMNDLLFRYFPFLTWNQVIITANKQMIRGDVLIDDGVHNLEGGSYKKILMTAPHNRNYDAEANGMIRVSNWTEIEKIIFDLAEHAAADCKP